MSVTWLAQKNPISNQVERDVMFRYWLAFGRVRASRYHHQAVGSVTKKYIFTLTLCSTYNEKSYIFE